MNLKTQHPSFVRIAKLCFPSLPAALAATTQHILATSSSTVVAPTPPPDCDSGPTGHTSSAQKAHRCYQKTSRIPVGVKK